MEILAVRVSRAPTPKGLLKLQERCIFPDTLFSNFTVQGQRQETCPHPGPTLEGQDTLSSPRLVLPSIDPIIHSNLKALEHAGFPPLSKTSQHARKTR